MTRPTSAAGRSSEAFDAAHAASTAAGRGLDEQREADRPRVGDDRIDLVRPVHGRRLERAGNDGDADLARHPAGGQLVAERGDRADDGPTNVSPASSTRPRELGSLREEAIARMDRLGARLERGRDDRVDPQVALGRRRRAEQHRDVGGPDVLAAASASL